MDHSIHGYLSRRTTEELETLLQHYLKEENHRHIILEILKVLKQRYVSTEISPHLLQTLEQTLRHFAYNADNSLY